MGGGDLNMKKHFHPLTMENLERVWKAEEKKRLEEERIQQLQSELQEERRREELQLQAVTSGLVKKKNEKLDWMYSGMQRDNTDEYLLGKRIDPKHMAADDKPDNVPAESSTRSYQPKASDVLMKVKEDPLFLIRKKEEESKKELALNPLKMQKMKELLEKQIPKKDKKKKKEKKKKKSKSRRSSVEDDSPRLYDRRESYDRTKRSPDRKRIETERHGHQRNGESDDRRRQEKDEVNSRRRHNHRQRSPESSFSREKHDESRRRDYRDRSPINKSNKTDRMEVQPRRSERRRSVGDGDDTNGGRRREKHDVGRREQMQDHDDRYSKRKEEQKKRERRKRNDTSSSEDDGDELEAKRMEMIQNAKIRNNQREESMKLLQKEKMQEEKEKKTRKQKAEFIQDMTLDAISSQNTSVEDRIKRGIFSKQRTNAAMDKFMSR